MTAPASSSRQPRMEEAVREVERRILRTGQRHRDFTVTRHEVALPLLIDGHAPFAAGSRRRDGEWRVYAHLTKGTPGVPRQIEDEKLGGVSGRELHYREEEQLPAVGAQTLVQ